MENDIRNNLERQFKKLMPEDAPPERLKEEIFQTLDTVNMIGDIADLFTSKFVQTGAKLMGIVNSEEDDESINEFDSTYDKDIDDNNDDSSIPIEEPDNNSQD